MLLWIAIAIAVGVWALGKLAERFNRLFPDEDRIEFEDSGSGEYVKVWIDRRGELDFDYELVSAGPPFLDARLAWCLYRMAARKAKIERLRAKAKARSSRR